MSGLVFPGIVMWSGQAVRESMTADKPVIDFVQGESLCSWLTDGINHPVILADRLVKALASDMRRSTFWL
jgi:hypothetical protein